MNQVAAATVAHTFDAWCPGLAVVNRITLTTSDAGSYALDQEIRFDRKLDHGQMVLSSQLILKQFRLHQISWIPIQNEAPSTIRSRCALQYDTGDDIIPNQITLIQNLLRFHSQSGLLRHRVPQHVPGCDLW